MLADHGDGKYFHNKVVYRDCDGTRPPPNHNQSPPIPYTVGQDTWSLTPTLIRRHCAIGGVPHGPYSSHSKSSFLRLPSGLRLVRVRVRVKRIYDLCVEVAQLRFKVRVRGSSQGLVGIA